MRQKNLARNYQSDREWSDQFIPEVSRIVGPYLLCPAPFERDAKEATDLIVLKARDMTIACRIRKPGYSDSYPNQITIRSKRESGADTELKKIVNGWGDWMFYGHCPSSPPLIDPWFLVDLSAFRAQLIRNPKQIRRGHKANGDGTYFAFFDLTTFSDDPPILVASSQTHCPF